MSALIKISTGNFDAMCVCTNKNEMWAGGRGRVVRRGIVDVGHTGVLVGKTRNKDTTRKT